MARLFISQDRLDSWSANDKASLADDLLTLHDLGRVFLVEPAVRFLTVAGNEADPNDLIGKVLSEEELADIGADTYMTSVIHGETAYEVQPGFIGRAISGA